MPGSAVSVSKAAWIANTAGFLIAGFIAFVAISEFTDDWPRILVVTGCFGLGVVAPRPWVIGAGLQVVNSILLFDVTLLGGQGHGSIALIAVGLGLSLFALVRVALLNSEVASVAALSNASAAGLLTAVALVVFISEPETAALRGPLVSPEIKENPGFAPGEFDMSRPSSELSVIPTVTRMDGSVLTVADEAVWLESPSLDVPERVAGRPEWLLIDDAGWFSFDPLGEVMLYHEVHIGRLWVAWVGGDWTLVDQSQDTGNLQLGDAQVRIDIVAVTENTMLVNTYEGWYEIPLGPSDAGPE